MSRLLGRSGLLWQKNCMDVGQHTTRGNGDSSQQPVQLFIVFDGKGDVAGHNTRLLVVASGVSSELQDFGTEVLKNSRQVDWCSSSHAGGVLSLTQVTSNTTNGELQTSFGRRSGGLLFSTTSFSFSCGVLNTDAKLISRRDALSGYS